MNDNLPAGPALPKAIQTYMFMRHHDWFLRRLRSNYSDVFTLRFILLGPTVCFGHPEAAREIFAQHHALEAGSVSALFSEPLLDESSIFLSDGDMHRDLRKALGPALADPPGVNVPRTLCRFLAPAFEAWSQREAVDFVPSYYEAGMRAFIALVLGEEEGPGLAELANELVEISGPLVRAVCSPDMAVIFLRRSQRWARLVRLRDRLLLLLATEQQRRRELRNTGTGLLGALMRAQKPDGSPLTPHEVSIAVTTMLGGSIDLMTPVLAFALQRIVTTPRVLDRLRRELHDIDLQNEPEAALEIPYLDAIYKETLRLHPVVVASPRRVIHPITLDGITFAPGQMIALLPWLVHRQPHVYNDPDLFLPERFVGTRFAAHEFVAFAGGSRHCLGSRITSQVLRTTLALLFGLYEVHLNDTRTRSIKLHGVVGHPDRPVRIRLRRRSVRARAA